MRNLSPPHPGLGWGQVRVRGKNHPWTLDCERGAEGWGEKDARNEPPPPWPLWAAT